MKRIGVLTGGGDTTALNATLKGIALQAEASGLELLGFVEGWKGVLEGRYVVLTPEMIDENCGGTIIKSSRTDLRKIEGGIDQSVANLKKAGVEGLIPIGGDDTLTVGAAFSKEFTTAFVTKTIDNDVGQNAPWGDTVDYERMINYFCPGFPTAAATFSSFVRSLRTTAYSHERVIVVEAMGRDMGWLALSGAYGDADIIIPPETRLNYEILLNLVISKFSKKRHLVISVAEGLKGEDGELITSTPDYLDAFGHAQPGGCSEVLAKRLKSDLAKELGTSNFNHIIPSYLQRCGSPIPIDRDTAIALGRKAVTALIEGKINHVACTKREGDNIVAVLLPIDRVLKLDEDGHVIGRQIDRRFYCPSTMEITPEGIEYFKPFLGPKKDAYRYPVLDIRQV